MREILLVEDNPGDVLLLRDAFTRCAETTRVHVAESGDQALRFLADQAENGRPDVILLDLNLPRMNGREVLARLRDLGFDIPVVVLSNSMSDRDGAECRALGASEYFCKPEELDEYDALVENVECLIR